MKFLTTVILFITLINISTVINAKPILHSVVRLPKLRSENPPLLILLHGFGSNEQDLFSFADKLPDRFLVISVRAPHVIGKDSYAWFHVDFSKGKPIASLDEVEKSRLLILQFIEELKIQ
jgi:phospholipase/carboxylesterase